MGRDWLACHITPTDDRCCECELWNCFPKLRETNVVIGDSWMVAPIPIASVKGQTRFIHVEDLLLHIPVNTGLTVHIMCGKSKRDQKFCPAVKPKLQVLICCLPDITVLGTIQFLCMDVLRSAAK